MTHLVILNGNSDGIKEQIAWLERNPRFLTNFVSSYAGSWISGVLALALATRKYNEKNCGSLLSLFNQLGRLVIEDPDRIGQLLEEFFVDFPTLADLKARCSVLVHDQERDEDILIDSTKYGYLSVAKLAHTYELGGAYYVDIDGKAAILTRSHKNDRLDVKYVQNPLTWVTVLPRRSGPGWLCDDDNRQATLDILDARTREALTGVVDFTDMSNHTAAMCTYVSFDEPTEPVTRLTDPLPYYLELCDASPDRSVITTNLLKSLDKLVGSRIHFSLEPLSFRFCATERWVAALLPELKRCPRD